MSLSTPLRWMNQYSLGIWSSWERYHKSQWFKGWGADGKEGSMKGMTDENNAPKKSKKEKKTLFCTSTTSFTEKFLQTTFLIHSFLLIQVINVILRSINSHWIEWYTTSVEGIFNTLFRSSKQRDIQHPFQQENKNRIHFTNFDTWRDLYLIFFSHRFPAIRNVTDTRWRKRLWVVSWIKYQGRK